MSVILVFATVISPVAVVYPRAKAVAAGCVLTFRSGAIYVEEAAIASNEAPVALWTMVLVYRADGTEFAP